MRKVAHGAPFQRYACFTNTRARLVRKCDSVYRQMLFSVQSQKIGGVAVIRCEGRLVVSEGVRLLQEEVEKHTLETKKYLLDLGAVSYVDSGGLGAMVRLRGTLRAHRGDLKLCRVSPFVQNVLRATNLHGVFCSHSTEAEALAEFARPARVEEHAWSSNTKVLCIDPSSDVLAYMTEVLKGAGFEVKTARYLSDATTLAGVMKPRMIVCGPGVQASGPVFEKFRRVDPKVQLLLVSEDFNSFDACDAGRDLVHRVNELLRTNPDQRASPGAP
jgi:anti-sigma B factor antagonist